MTLYKLLADNAAVNILFRDDYFVFIDKPSGFHVHQPEDPRFRAPPEKVCLQVLRNQLNQYIYPLHRLDSATSGVLGFAFSKEATKAFLKLQDDKKLQKEYFTVVRGYLPDEGIIDIPLKSDSSENMLEAKTLYKKLGQIEIPHPVGKRFQSARYSCAQVQIESGRYHQIRRHMGQISHPVVGDTKHGDSHHNRFFRETLKMPGLFLRANKLEFFHPFTEKKVTVEAGWNDMWLNFFHHFPMETAMKSTTKLLLTLTLSFLFWNSKSEAWGGHGHDTICEAATHLVKDKDLKDFLTTRSHIMGHLCNIPDTHWRSLGAISESGNSAHFFEPDLVGAKVEDVSTDYNKVIKKYQGQPNLFKEGATVFSVPKELGSSWWRAEQFARLTTEAGKKAKKSPPPANRQEEQNYDLDYNKNIYDMIVAMGLLGHFTGDVTQPFHNTADYDGWKKNHGGIHGFYEEAVVGILPETLQSDIVKVALADSAQYKFLKTKDVVEAMKMAAILSYPEIDEVINLDELKKPSEKKMEKGMELKVFAERPDVHLMAPKFSPLITKQMARSAALLAHIWDLAYVKAGKPNLTAYKSYKFPFQPDFVAPDYYKEEAKK